MSPMTADVDLVLRPVDAAAPAGAELRYQPIFDEIKAARRIAEADPNELAPWKKVAELVLKAAGRSKDLQLAIWLLEALSRLDGFPGTSTGLLILRRLVDEYWESVYPQLDPDDPDPRGFRRALVDWVDEKLPAIVKGIPLSGPPAFYGLLHYEVTQKTGDERKALLDEGWPTGERFTEALHAAPQAHLEALLAAVVACQTELAALQTVVDQRFNTAAPGQDRADPLTFGTLKGILETAQWLVERPIKKRAQEQGGAPGHGLASPAVVGAAPAVDVNGDQVWAEALNLTRGSRVDGLRLLQGQLASAVSGRDRFLRQLQLAELGLEAGVYSLAFPVFDELARTIDSRQLEEWEDRVLIARVFKGLARCCGLLKAHDSTSAAREAEALDRVARLESTPSA